MKDAHDPREFRQWVTLAPDGTVAAVHEFAEGTSTAAPLPNAIDVTPLGRVDFRSVRVEPGKGNALDQITLQVAKK